MSVYDDREKVVVTPYNGSQLNYGFLTNASDATRAALGHQDAAAAAGVVVYGCNRPKPGRMTLKRLTGSESSFVDWQSYASALAAGWKLTKGVIYGPTPLNTPRSVRVGCEIAPGIRVAWVLGRESFTAMGADLAAMGITPLTAAESARAVSGPNSITGARVFGAEKVEETRTLSVKYIDPTRADNLPEGWRVTTLEANAEPDQAAPN